MRAHFFLSRFHFRFAVVASTIYLSKYTEDFADFNEAYVSMFTSDPKPSRTCIGVANLPAGTDVEITCQSGVTLASRTLSVTP
jgi:enamine deaminase RidA (YjgF/YER057c/UK114 family)